MSGRESRLADDGGRAAFRRFVERHAIDTAEAERAETRLSDEIEELQGAGHSNSAAFLLAIGRLAREEPLAGMFSRARGLSAAAPRTRFGEPIAALGFAVAAAAALKAPELFDIRMDDAGAWFYQRNLSLFLLAPVAAYLGWRRGLAPRSAALVAALFLVGALLVNAYPFTSGGSTGPLAALHLGVALWFAVGFASTGGGTGADGWIRFVRFTGELLVCFALLGLGGIVLSGTTALLFSAIGLEFEPFFARWVLPCGVAGALVVGAFLVETKRRMTEDLAPMLARVFTPLFALALVGFLGAMAVTGSGMNPERELLIGVDLLLVVVLGLLLYSVFSRERRPEPGVADFSSLVLVGAALLVDIVALGAIGGRIVELGLTPNRTAALGLNLILLANLGGSAWLLLGLVRRRIEFAALERWQLAFLPVYAGWAALVAVVFPLLFTFR